LNNAQIVEAPIFESSKPEPQIEMNKRPNFEKSEHSKSFFERAGSFFQSFDPSALKSIAKTLMEYFRNNDVPALLPPEVVKILKSAPGTIKMLINLGLLPPHIAMVIQPILAAFETGQEM